MLPRWVARIVWGAWLAVSSVVLRATVAFAQAYPGGGENPPKVKGEQFFNGGGNNANTGMDILLFMLLALLALVIGLLLHRVSRRRTARSAD